MRNRTLWSWGVGLIVLAAWVSFACFTERRQEEEHPEPVVLWSGYTTDGDRVEANQEIRILEALLRDVVFSAVDFDGKPFVECLEYINTTLEEESGREPVHFQIDPDIPIERQITLRLKQVPLAEVLRYTTSLNQCKYKVSADRTIEIVHVDSAKSDDEGWFQTYPAFFNSPQNVKGPVDVQSQLEAIGVTFRSQDVAEYYPDRELLWVKGTRDQLELIDAYLNSIVYCEMELTWRDRVYELWWTLSESWRARAPAATVPAASAGPDPFGGGPTGGAAPDPFGGGN